MDEHGPDIESSGGSTPPAERPIGVAASAPLLPSGSSVSRVPARQRGLRGLMESALDGLDMVADRIAGAAGLR